MKKTGNQGVLTDPFYHYPHLGQTKREARGGNKTEERRAEGGGSKGEVQWFKRWLGHGWQKAIQNRQVAWLVMGRVEQLEAWYRKASERQRRVALLAGWKLAESEPLPAASQEWLSRYMSLKTAIAGNYLRPQESGWVFRQAPEADKIPVNVSQKIAEHNLGLLIKEAEKPVVPMVEEIYQGSIAAKMGGTKGRELWDKLLVSLTAQMGMDEESSWPMNIAVTMGVRENNLEAVQWGLEHALKKQGSQARDRLLCQALLAWERRIPVEAMAKWVERLGLEEEFEWGNALGTFPLIKEEEVTSMRKRQIQVALEAEGKRMEGGRAGKAEEERKHGQPSSRPRL